MRSSYRERPAAGDLRDELVCGWAATVGDDGLTLVPDGCLDLVWLEDGRLIVCGPETTMWRTALPAGTRSVGIRFRPGVAPPVLAVPAVALRNSRVGLTDLWGDAAAGIGQRVGEETGAGARVAVLEGIVRRRLAEVPPVDPVARDIVSRLAAPHHGPVSSFAEAYGLSERQLHRRCTNAFGYGPSVLGRILRLQRFLGLAREATGRPSLAVLAAVAGYADQAHLSRECRAIAGSTPSVLVA